MADNRSLQQLNDASYYYQMEIYNEMGDESEWVMKNGEGILIKDMKDNHIKNCISMLNRKPLNGTRKAWIEIFESVILTKRTLKINKITNKINEK